VKPNSRTLTWVAWAAVLLGLISSCQAARTASSPRLDSSEEIATLDKQDSSAVGGAQGSTSLVADGGADDGEAHHDVIDDSAEELAVTPELGTAAPHPLDGWSEEQLRSAVKNDLASLGSISLGSANAGSLINGVQAVETSYYKPVSPSGSWATQETLDYLERALRKVHEEFPDTQPLALGDISGKNGGPARPHLSHQSGRDVDIGYFYTQSGRWYARGTAKNLDLPRNWAFVRALIAETDVDLILIDRSIQVLLERHALEIGEDPEWLAGIFKGAAGRLRPIIRHAPGHATHIHIRFFNPLAQETGRRCFELLVDARLASPAQGYVTHRVKKNETLGMIAKKYGTSVPRLRAANGLKSSLIREKRVLTIPIARRGSSKPPERLRIPARRVPPSRRTVHEGPRASAAQPPPTK
jgi:LysM repeat protein/murein endopeptidase